MEGWICSRCGKSNAPWVMQCTCKANHATYNNTNNGFTKTFTCSTFEDTNIKNIQMICD